MAQIPGFPQALLDMHHHWHEPGAHPGAPGGRVHPFGTTGAGTEFLQFHRDFMTQFHAWYDVQPFGAAPFNAAPFNSPAAAQAAVAGWTSIPTALKNGAVTGWGGVQIAQEARLTTLSPPFASDDELGAYIEGGIHGWIHGATAAAYGDPVVGTFHSPLSTYFYGIHGLVDYWWRRWALGTKRPIKEIIDTKAHIKDFKEHKEFIKDHKELILEKLHPEKPLKEKDKDKDIFEGGGIPDPIGDPFGQATLGGAQSGFGDAGALMRLHQRMNDLETKLSQQAFITPAERPAVGEAAHSHDELLAGKKTQNKKPS